MRLTRSSLVGCLAAGFSGFGGQPPGAVALPGASAAATRHSRGAPLSLNYEVVLWNETNYPPSADLAPGKNAASGDPMAFTMRPHATSTLRLIDQMRGAGQLLRLKLENRAKNDAGGDGVSVDEFLQLQIDMN
jgi:hypothetical protein